MHPMKNLLCLMILYALPAFALANTMVFEADDQLQANARKWANQFVQFAEAEYDIELNFSLQSIKYLDELVDDLHATFVAESPPEEEIFPVARALGSYVAEVYRIFNGGKWGWFIREGESFPGVETTKGSQFFPVERVLARIKTHTDPDIWEYYLLMTQH